LLALSGTTESVKHALNSIVIAVNKGIVENNRYCPSSFGKHCAHGEADEDGNLLLRAVGEAIERLGSVSLDAGDFKAVTQLKLGSREQIIQEWPQVPTYGLVVALPPFSKTGGDRVAQQLKRRYALLKLRALALSDSALFLGRRERLTDAVAAGRLYLAGQPSNVALKLSELIVPIRQGLFKPIAARLAALNLVRIRRCLSFRRQGRRSSLVRGFGIRNLAH
jgi:hypothetical protein